MNDEELEERLRDAFDAVELPDHVRRSTLEACARLANDESDDANTASGAEVIEMEQAASRHRPRKRRYWRGIGAAAACLVLGVACFGAFRIFDSPSDPDSVPAFDTVATAFVDIDVNPSIELQMNASDEVVGAEGLNEDGQAVLAGLSLTGLPYSEAFDKIARSEAFAGYLGNDSYVQVSVASDDQRQEQALMSVSEQQLAALPCRGSCDAVSLELHEEAHAHGMGCGRYSAALELSELDPNVTVDDCKDMSMREIRDQIASHHGELSSTPSQRGQGNGYHNGPGHGRHHAHE